MFIHTMQFFKQTVARLGAVAPRHRARRGNHAAPIEILERREVKTNQAPEVDSIVRLDPLTLSAVEVNYAVTFTTDVTGVDATDFRVDRTGTVSGGTVQVTAQSASVYNVKISGLGGTGTVGLTVLNDLSIQDSSQQPLSGGAVESLFGTQVNRIITTFPYRMTVGDLNNDTIPDIVVSDFSVARVGILLGNGDGTFGVESTITGLPSPRHTTIADVNGDSNLDLIVSTYGSLSVAVLLGNGNGTFGTPSFTSIFQYPIETDVGDVNNDGNVDIVVAKLSGGYTLLLGNGNGTFASPISSPSFGTTTTLSVGDLNGDGFDDIVVGDYANSTARIFISNGDGTFLSPTTVTTPSLPQSVKLGDLNGDGHLDLVVGSTVDNQISVFLGNGNGTFGASNPTTVPAVRSLQLADINADGRLDIVASQASNGSNLLLGNGDGTFQTNYSLNTGLLTFDTAVADLNGDNVVDLVVNNLITNSIGVRLGIPPTVSGPTYVLGPTVDLSTSSPTFGETGGSATITATLSTAAVFDVTIQLGFAGSATNIGDYTRSASQIVILAGQTTGSITLAAVSDTDIEGDENIVVSLGTITNGVAGTQTIATATLVDDDTPPAVNLSFVPGTFAEAGGTAQVVATLAAPTTRQVTINLNFGGIAEQGLDYATSGSQIVIEIGQTTGFITLTALDDGLPEIDESLIVSLGELTNGSAGATASVTGAITDSTALGGTWFINGRPTSISQTQSGLTFTNELGRQSAGRVVSATQIIADDWNGMTGTLVGTNRIEWANGTVWTRTGTPPAVEDVPTLSTSWSYNGSTSIAQAGASLTFTNEMGQTSTGRFVSATQVVADQWGITGTLIGSGQIQWSNGTSWLSLAAPSFTPPTLAASWTIGLNLLPTFILGSGASVTLVNEMGSQSRGQLISETQIVALDWMGIIGTLSNANSRINWSNNTQWDVLDNAFSSL